MIITAIWYVWEKRREAKYDREDQDLEKGSEDMEKNIMAMMRKRTMSKASTWETSGQKGFDAFKKSEDVSLVKFQKKE